MHKYADNEWGFDVNTTAPFLAFRALRERAIYNVGEANVLDLSQGEPGYGFAPNTRSREFFAFLLLLDIEFNNNQTGEHFAEYSNEDLPKIFDRVKKVAEENYVPEKAEKMLADFQFFLKELFRVSEEQKLGFGKFEILYDIFKYSIPSGGRYPNPWGEPIVKATVANDYSRLLNIPVQNDDLILINGASHGIGTAFKALGEDGIGFLTKGDWVVMTSPVYAPYNNLMEDRGLNVFSLSIDPRTGEVDTESLKTLKNFPEKIKAMVLINPNNPSGFPYGKALLKELGEVAEKHNSLIIADEVYLEFFENAKSILSVESARKRTIHITSLSKIERGTGVRFGTFLVLPEAREFITNEILGTELLGDMKNIFWLLYMAKSPGGKTLGAFQHITGIPGPSQILGLCHYILGKEERTQYILDLRKKVEIFYETLGVKHQGNLYYGMFDISELESASKKDLSVEEKLSRIAEKGVVLMPANLFFSEQDRTEKNCRPFIRTSLPNLSFENTKKAAEIIRTYLSE